MPRAWDLDVSIFAVNLLPSVSLLSSAYFSRVWHAVIVDPFLLEALVFSALWSGRFSVPIATL